MGQQLQVARLFFIHIPKVGGTSLQSFLRSFYDAEEICPSPETGIWNITRLTSSVTGCLWVTLIWISCGRPTSAG